MSGSTGRVWRQVAACKDVSVRRWAYIGGIRGRGYGGVTGGGAGVGRRRPTGRAGSVGRRRGRRNTGSLEHGGGGGGARRTSWWRRWREGAGGRGGRHRRGGGQRCSAGERDGGVGEGQAAAGDLGSVSFSSRNRTRSSGGRFLLFP